MESNLAQYNATKRRVWQGRGIHIYNNAPEEDVIYDDDLIRVPL